MHTLCIVDQVSEFFMHVRRIVVGQISKTKVTPCLQVLTVLTVFSMTCILPHLSQNVSHPAFRPKYGFVPNIVITFLANLSQLTPSKKALGRLVGVMSVKVYYNQIQVEQSRSGTKWTE